MQCSGMQGIYAQLTGGFICLLYIWLVLDLAVGVVVCKASVLGLLGGLSPFYIYIFIIHICSAAVCKASVLN